MPDALEVLPHTTSINRSKYYTASHSFSGTSLPASSTIRLDADEVVRPNIYLAICADEGR